MEVEYSFPGPIKIKLDKSDLDSVRTNGYCMDRNGFLSIESKVWVRTDNEHREANATIDGDGDLNIWLPGDATSPTVIEREQVSNGNDVRGEGIVEHFLADGSVEVTWPHNGV